MSNRSESARTSDLTDLMFSTLRRSSAVLSSLFNSIVPYTDSAGKDAARGKRPKTDRRKRQRRSAGSSRPPCRTPPHCPDHISSPRRDAENLKGTLSILTPKTPVLHRHRIPFIDGIARKRPELIEHGGRWFLQTSLFPLVCYTIPPASTPSRPRSRWARPISFRQPPGLIRLRLLSHAGRLHRFLRLRSIRHDSRWIQASPHTETVLGSLTSEQMDERSGWASPVHHHEEPAA